MKKDLQYANLLIFHDKLLVIFLIRKSLWIKASAKLINANGLQHYNVTHEVSSVF